jgi:hypothetical protein
MNESAFHQRAINDIIISEHELRRNAENTAREMRAILSDIAFRLDGGRIETLRHDDPHAPGNWSPFQWKQFFQEVQSVQPGWEKPIKAEPDAKLEALLTENQGLREMIVQLKAQLANLEKGVFKRTRTKAQSVAVPPRSTHPTPAVPLEFEDMIEPLRRMALHRKPLHFQTAFSESESLYRRQLMILYALAKKGINVRIELDLLMSIVEGIGPRSSTVRKVVEKLVKGGLLSSEVHTIERPIHTAINLVQLTPDAVDYCRVMGWQVIESEWERLNQLQGGEEMREKNVAITILAFHARLRGYRVKVLPETKGMIFADVLLTDAEKNTFNIFVLLEDTLPKEMILQTRTLRGTVGICALDPGAREKFAGKCLQNGITHGVATDLKSLICGDAEDQKPMLISEITSKSLMWAGKW